MSFHLDGPNNEFGTHDRVYQPRRFGEPTGKRVRDESSAHTSIKYQIKPKVTDGLCPAYLRMDGFHEGMCSRKGHKEYRGLLFCGTHYPPNVFARAEKRDRKMREQWEERDRRWQYQSDMAAWQNTCINALREIAKGELNDPAGYAAMILEEKPQK